MGTYKVRNKNWVEVVDLVEESSIIPDDQVYDKSSSQIENSLHEFDTAFD